MKTTKTGNMLMLFGLILFMMVLIQTGFTYEFEVSPFSGKLIFCETPEIGKKWHGGIRLNDILVFDGYWNIYNWLTIDFLRAGINDITIDTSGSALSDRFSIFTIEEDPIR
jgi:hypothetical protein